MKKFSFFLILFFSFTIYCDEEIDPTIFFKKFEDKDMQKNYPNINFQILDLDPEVKKKVDEETLNGIKDIVLQDNDEYCVHKCFYEGEQLLRYLTSKFTSDYILYEVDLGISGQNISYGITIRYEIYESKEKARIGTRYKYTAGEAAFTEETKKRLNKSYTGKKFGDFSLLHDTSMESTNLFIDILYDRVWFSLQIYPDNENEKLDPSLLDKWAEAIIKKIEKAKVKK